MLVPPSSFLLLGGTSVIKSVKETFVIDAIFNRMWWAEELQKNCVKFHFSSSTTFISYWKFVRNEGLVIDVICRSWEKDFLSAFSKSTTILHTRWLRVFPNTFVLWYWTIVKFIKAQIFCVILKGPFIKMFFSDFTSTTRFHWSKSLELWNWTVD